ncbi:BA71V-C122R [Elysia marginata]|uniref:BA71V-C122R n=1 Tax=Elysia marginata TaxID=1093978 RepID=A0AAV4GV83_9GAST|nr:BA71V-C122R [Elysia marginata]
MRTCPQCDRAMVRATSSGVVTFVCFCGVQEEGSSEDARIAGDVLNAGETEEMYRRLIKNAAFDRVNQQVKRDCPKCGLDYMTQIRVGAREVVVWTCTCGYDSSRGKEAAALLADNTSVV